MKNFKIFMIIAVLFVNTASLNAAGFNEKTVSAANYVITTGGGSGGYQLDDSSTHTHREMGMMFQIVIII